MIPAEVRNLPERELQVRFSLIADLACLHKLLVVGLWVLLCQAAYMSLHQHRLEFQGDWVDQEEEAGEVDAVRGGRFWGTQ